MTVTKTSERFGKILSGLSDVFFVSVFTIKVPTAKQCGIMGCTHARGCIHGVADKDAIAIGVSMDNKKLKCYNKNGGSWDCVGGDPGD